MDKFLNRLWVKKNSKRILQILKIKIIKSKTDQFGEGMIKAIPYFNNEEFCPIINLKKMCFVEKRNKLAT